MKGKLARMLGGALLTPGRVVSAESVGEGFRKVRLSTELAAPQAGTKIQLLLPSDDMRTYSPIASEGDIVLLGFTQPGGPGAQWMREVQPGESVRFFRPQTSLSLRRGPAIVVGDETSVAVAAAFSAERPGQVQAVLATKSVEDVQVAAAAVGLRPFAVLERANVEGLVEAVLTAQQAAPQSALALTGGSELIIAVRAALRERGVRDLQTKSYWVPGRRGLD